MNVEISIDCIIWMLEHPEELNSDEKLWVDTFVGLMNDEVSKYKDKTDEHSIC